MPAGSPRRNRDFSQPLPDPLLGQTHRLRGGGCFSQFPPQRAVLPGSILDPSYCKKIPAGDRNLWVVMKARSRTWSRSLKEGTWVVTFRVGRGQGREPGSSPAAAPLLCLWPDLFASPGLSSPIRRMGHTTSVHGHELVPTGRKAMQPTGAFKKVKASEQQLCFWETGSGGESCTGRCSSLWRPLPHPVDPRPRPAARVPDPRYAVFFPTQTYL